MTRSSLHKPSQKITSPPLPVEIARLTRLDYAATIAEGVVSQADVTAVRTASRAAASAKCRAIRGGAVLTAARGPDMDVVIANPQQISVAMRTSYAAELLSQLRAARKLRRGECCQISIDCPVEIVMDASTLDALIDKLVSEVGGDA